MVRCKHVSCALLLMILSGVAMAQNNTNSPYTRYGYGELSPQIFGKSRGMGGVAYGLRDAFQINAVNPASYTVIDSLTLIFDVGLSLQNANLSDGVTKMNVGNSSFDYAAMQFRLHRRVGMTLGVLPFSSVGYRFSSSDTSNPDNISTITYSGEGGLHQAFLGVGVKVLDNLSVGANASYLWGDITRTSAVSFTSGEDYNFQRDENVSIKDIKIDIGAQYTHRIDAKREMTIGAVISPKTNLNNTAYIQTQTYLSTSDYNIEKTDLNATLGLPMSMGVGVSYIYDRRLTVAADYTLQKWSQVKYKDENAFYDMNKVALGLEFLPGFTGRSYFSYIKYRVGGYYSTPYYKVKDASTGAYYRASKEYGLSAGLALPIPRTRSLVSISGQYVNVSGKGVMLDERYLRLSIGVTFNERWFFKRKVN